MKQSIRTLGCVFIAFLLLFACKNDRKNNPETVSEKQAVQYPNDVIPFMDKWKILLGDGTNVDDLTAYQKEDFFYTVSEDETDWVVYKTPNTGTTSPNSKNTRTELAEIKRWKPTEGGKLTGTLKIQHVSTTGDARAAASYSVVVGQIHSDDGHKNEPLKIFYKKFPGHEKGSVFWNYEINTSGSNNERWDFSTAVWGYDMSMVGTSPDAYPEEPQDGIALGEAFSYTINVYKGVMYLTFASDGHETKTFTKSLIKSDYTEDADIPQQIRTLYAAIGRDGVEQPEAYANETQFFKQGAYNQTNGKNPEDNMVWSTGAQIYGGDIKEQYANGSYTEVWFKKGTLGPGTPPKMDK